MSKCKFWLRPDDFLLNIEKNNVNVETIKKTLKREIKFGES